LNVRWRLSTATLLRVRRSDRSTGLSRRERTKAGLDAARARGSKGGRPWKLYRKKRVQARTLHRDKANTIGDICRTLHISRTTLYRYLAEGKTDARAR
jgi:DNA invertase Pin-like site-specific DNA recombinase